MSLLELLQNRKSVRHFSSGSLSIEHVEKLVYAGIGIRSGNKRVVPSAGGCYPLEMFLVIGDVVGMESGIYHYQPKTLLRPGDFRQGLYDASLRQSSIATAQISIIIAANYEKITSRYGKRGYRYTYMEAGHVGQNIALQAVELGLGTVMIGAFNDNAVRTLLEIEEDPLYIIPVGLLS